MTQLLLHPDQDKLFRLHAAREAVKVRIWYLLRSDRGAAVEIVRERREAARLSSEIERLERKLRKGGEGLRLGPDWILGLDLFRVGFAVHLLTPMCVVGLTLGLQRTHRSRWLPRCHLDRHADRGTNSFWLFVYLFAAMAYFGFVFLRHRRRDRKPKRRREFAPAMG
jgi:hypothetical protein